MNLTNQVKYTWDTQDEEALVSKTQNKRSGLGKGFKTVEPLGENLSLVHCAYPTTTRTYTGLASSHHSQSSLGTIPASVLQKDVGR
jgi:hypothetical protein